MLENLKRVAASVALLFVASGILLFSDLRSRVSSRKAAQSRTPSVAILKHASNVLLDEVERGVIERLSARGYKDGGRINLRRYCAEGDLPTANAIAKQITDGSFRMVISISTMSLQVVANANRDGRAIHVFGAVTDPAGAGVGIRAMDSTNKPPYLTGIGSFQPVEQIFRMARELWPELSMVGVVWNPTERNSETCTIKARAICRELNIRLLEANVEQSKDVKEAADSLVARGVQAFWTGPDVTVLSATAALCECAINAKIPVFSNMAGHVFNGSLFDLGAHYTEVGRETGRIAADVLDGADPAQIVVRNFMPERVMLNEQILARMRDPWRFTESARTRASVILGPSGQVVKGDPAVGTKETNLARPAPKAAEAAPAKGPVLRLPLAKTWRIQEINYIESPMVEEAMAGLRDWLKESGLVDNRDYTLGTLSAQGDMAMLGSLFDAARTKEVDVFMVYSTPTLQVALKKAGDRPVVFNVVANPFIVGAGKNDLDHQPNVTGVYTVGPYAAFADMLQRHFPNYRKVGTMFCPAEVNSVANKDLYVAEATKRGITVEVVPANGAAELADAAIALCRRDIQAVTQIVDNLSASGFLAVARAAEQAKLPLFGMQDAAAQQGAAVVLSRDYREAGRNAAEKLARIMMGESPAAIPFSPPAKVKLVVSLKNARKLGVGVPEALLQKADLVIKE